MAHPTVTQLVRRIPPPRDPDPFQGTTLNSSIGGDVELPRDYLEFMRIYGPGYITEAGHPSIWILDLAGVSDAEMIQKELKVAAEDHKYDDTTYPPAFPSVPGLLPWGIWDQGGILYWWTTGAAHEWTIAVKLQIEFERYACTFTEYLLGNIAGQPGRAFRTYLIPQDGREVRYCPSSRYRECFTGEYKP